MADFDRYNEFVKEHRDVLAEYTRVLIDVAEQQGIQPTKDSETERTNLVADLIGSSGDHNTRLLASLIVGALERA